jgi:hypothetical protein
MSFIVNHPDLCSESLAPTGVACAKFDSVRFDFHLEEKTVKRKKGRKRRPRTCRNHTPRDETQSEVKSRYLLRNAIRKVDYAESSDSNVGDSSTPSDDPAATRRHTVGGRAMAHHGRNSTAGANPSPEGLDLLVRAAFHRFLGSKRTGNGVKFQQDFDGPSLVDIAPAVWNLRYLQV